MTRSGTVYALLVGIDTYPSPVPPLRGCVNDIERFATMLRERVEGEGQLLDLLPLRNEDATRQRIIDAFEQHLGQAGEADVALFYYSGHGSQSPSPPEFWHLEPDRLDETLVCYDSRLSGGWDLADKELAYLIEKLAKKNPHIVAILDACHSGSGTRNLDDVGIRRLPTDDRARPFETFLGGQSLAGQAGRSPTGSGWFDLPVGRHIVLSACRADEEARESSFGGERRGVFSYYLLETLQQIGPGLAYRDLFRRVEARVRSTVGRQSPQIEATNNVDLDLAFLGGAIGSGRPSFTVRRYSDDVWMLDAGAVHGIAEGEDSERTVVALFPLDATAEHLHSGTEVLGTATVISVDPGESRVEVALRDGTRPAADSYKAIVVGVPLPPLLVDMEGEPGALDLVRAALQRVGGDGKPSLLVREVQSGEEGSAIHVLASGQHYRIRRTGDAFPLAVTVEQFSAASADRVVQHLEHIARWLNIVQLANPASQIPADAVRVELYPVDPATGRASDQPFDAAALDMRYTKVGDELIRPAFKAKLINTTNRELYCVLLDLPETYSISAGLLPEGRVRLGPHGTAEAEVWAFSGKNISLYIPKPLREQGVSMLRDVFKVLVSTADADGRLLEQPDLAVSYERGQSKGVFTNTTLARLMRRVNTRHAGGDPDEQEVLADWRTSEMLLSVTIPANGSPVPSKGVESVELAAGVHLFGHNALRARARLVTQDEASRGVGNLALPAPLRDHPEVNAPFQLVTSRSAVPGISVLELFFEDHEGATYQAATPDQPLVLRTQATVGDRAGVLPLAFDGEFFLPLGTYKRLDEGGTEIRLERLPHPTSEGKRSLGGAIKIYFQKLLSDRLAIKSLYPRLAIPAVAATGIVSYNDDVTAIKAAVSAARSVVLYIHGIIGDNTETVRSAAQAGLPGSSIRTDTLVLTFDYESLSTKIERTAQHLKHKLQEVGLGADHGKQLHIVAHSMGGLVARWFIEKEGGSKVVQRLTMLGTPNGGSPWPTIQDWATTAIGIGINFVGSVAWPVKALGWLVAAIEAVDEPLDAMKQGSDLLESLKNSDDPQVAYTIVAGNTSNIEAIGQQAGEAGVSALGRLLARITPQGLLHDVTALAFLRQPNDIFASVHSITAVPAHRTPRPLVREIACDHLTYFTAEAGLNALAAALRVAEVTPDD